MIVSGRTEWPRPGVGYGGGDRAIRVGARSRHRAAASLIAASRGSLRFRVSTSRRRSPTGMGTRPRSGHLCHRDVRRAQSWQRGLGPRGGKLGPRAGSLSGRGRGSDSHSAVAALETSDGQRARPLSSHALAGAHHDRRFQCRSRTVLVMVTYHIDPKTREPFLEALEKAGRERRRDGAYEWRIYEEPSEKGCFVETFLSDSWLDHLRQHERVTNAGPGIGGGGPALPDWRWTEDDASRRHPLSAATQMIAWRAASFPAFCNADIPSISSRLNRLWLFVSAQHRRFHDRLAPRCSCSVFFPALVVLFIRSHGAGVAGLCRSAEGPQAETESTRCAPIGALRSTLSY